MDTFPNRRKKKKKQNETIIKDIIKVIRALFEKEDYYEPKRVSYFWNMWNLRNVVIDLQNSDAWKTQLSIAINFIPSKDSEKEHVMHPGSSGNVKLLNFSMTIFSMRVKPFIKKHFFTL